jgi:hypothetical protein
MAGCASLSIPAWAMLGKAISAWRGCAPSFARDRCRPLLRSARTTSVAGWPGPRAPSQSAGMRSSKAAAQTRSPADSWRRTSWKSFELACARLAMSDAYLANLARTRFRGRKRSVPMCAGGFARWKAGPETCSDTRADHTSAGHRLAEAADKERVLSYRCQHQCAHHGRPSLRAPRCSHLANPPSPRGATVGPGTGRGEGTPPHAMPRSRCGQRCGQRQADEASVRPVARSPL